MPVPLKRFCCVMLLTMMQSSVWAFPLPKGVTQITSVEGITEYRLANGLKILLLPDPGKPTVTVNMTYLVGSRFENYGETGMAHLLEHMMFKGTPNVPHIDTQFNQRGMRSNATTALDRTNYFEQFEARDDNLHWAIKMEADRMVHSRISKKDLDSEMTVVRNEYEMGENSPENILLKRLQSAAFDWHNYGHATIGNRSDIENVNIQHLQAFYHLYYQPDNAVLIVSGKFEPATTLQWIAAEFGAIPKPQRHLPEFWTEEPVQDGERQFMVRRKGDTQLIMVGYKIPAALHPDNAAITFAADMLTDNPSGRLYKELVQTGRAVDVFATTVGAAAPGLVVLGAVVKNTDAIEPVRDALVAGIEAFAGNAPSQQELDRMKRNYRNQAEKIASDPQSLSLELSEDIALGDWRYFFRNRDQTDLVSAEQIREAAAKYLRRDNRTVGMFVPEDDPQRAQIPTAPPVAAVMLGFQPKAAVQRAEAFDPSPENIDRRTVHIALNGINVALLNKKNNAAIVSVALDLHWGDEESLFGKKMISLLTAEMLMRGNQLYTREQITDEFSKLKISGDLNRFDTTRENLPAALALVAQILKQPSFDRNEFEQLKKQVAASLESQRSDPSALAVQSLHQHFNHYPDGDWRASATIDESIEAVDAIELEDLKSFHRQFYGASHGELSIVGDFDEKAVVETVRQTLANWPSQASYKRIADSYDNIDAVNLTVDTPDKENGLYLARINLDMDDSNPQYPALVIANYIFGGGAELDSRLMERLRQKQGLSYGAGSSLHVDGFDKAGFFQINAIAAPQNLAQVAKSVREELQRAVGSGFTAEEVRRAKSGWAQQEMQARSEDGSLVEELNQNQRLQRDFLWSRDFENKVKNLTADQVNAAFRAWIIPEKLAVVIAGDGNKSGDLSRKEH